MKRRVNPDASRSERCPLTSNKLLELVEIRQTSQLVAAEEPSNSTALLNV